MSWRAIDDEIFRVGKHLYAVCPHCRGIIKVTGWFRGSHFCSRRYAD